MKKKEVFENIGEAIIAVKPNFVGGLSEEDNIYDDLGLSSFDILVFIHDLSSRLNVNISDTDIRENLKIKNLMNLIIRKGVNS